VQNRPQFRNERIRKACVQNTPPNFGGLLHKKIDWFRGNCHACGEAHHDGIRHEVDDSVILTSQIKDLLGMSLSVPEPGGLVPKVTALMQALPSVRLPAVATGVLTIAIVGLCRRFRPHWPGMLMAVVVVSFLGFALNMPVDTIGSRFGGIPQTLPVPSLPLMSFDLKAGVLPAALSFALLGSIESLLSATVADSMGRRPVLDELAERPKAFILDFSQVPLLGSTAAATLDGFTRKTSALVYVTGAAKQLRRILMTHRIRPPRVRFRSDMPIHP
jgi:MFS superfamily sulfate permease-like transporter